MDVAKISLTHRGETDSPAIVKAQIQQPSKQTPAQMVSKQPSVESSTYIPQNVIYKKSLPRHVDMRKGGGASGSMRSQVNSTGDAINMSSNQDFVPPNSAPENIADGSQKSGKKLKVIDVEMNKTQAMNSRQ